MIDAVLIDVGGVFMAPDHDALRPAIVAAGGSGEPDRLDHGHYAGIAAMDAAGSVEWVIYQEAVARVAGVPEERVPEAMDGLQDLMMRSALVWRRVLPGSLDGLRRIADTGVAIGIISNSDGTVERQLLEAGICQVGEGAGVRVEVIVDSAIAGIEKPDPRIFRLAMDAMAVEASRSVYVGDTVFADVVGARAAGMRPLHMDPYSCCRRDDDDHDHVRSLSEVAEIVSASR
jgi:putative hydrolase of the HAD superfamily